MADRTTILAVVPKGPFPAAVAAGDLDVVETAADTANKNRTLYTGKEVLVARNSGAADAHTITLTAKADPYGATTNIATYSLAAGDLVVFNFRNGSERWVTDGYLYYEADHAEIKFTVLQI